MGLSSNLPPGLSSVLGETLIWKDLDGILDLSWGLGVNLTLILRDCRASVEVYALFGIIWPLSLCQFCKLQEQDTLKDLYNQDDDHQELANYYVTASYREKVTNGVQ